MSNLVTREFSISRDDSDLFSRLSGDFNPLHIDRATARRTRFGGTVTHGVHLFIRALNELAPFWISGGQAPTAVSATFHSPIPSGGVVCLRATADGQALRFTAEHSRQRSFTGAIEMGSPFGIPSWPISIDDCEFQTGVPSEVGFPPRLETGQVRLRIGRSLFALLFPSLARFSDAGWIADLLATTQIVGMHCPGMHSIYSGFRLAAARQRTRASTVMQYSISGTEKRLQLLRMEVVGAYFCGTLDTFFRPRPIIQQSMKEVATAVSPNEFSNHRVLIVGGSRGLGELTAKVIASGGGDVTISYVHGREDADRVCAEILARGCRCTTLHMDVLSLTLDPAEDRLTEPAFSHVYFFASPLIGKKLGRWDENLFATFTHVYVSAFAALVERLTRSSDKSRGAVRFLYPSSVFVTQPQPGFAEYAVAKAAGEALCDQLQERYRAAFLKPRLPRMRTDQTSGLSDNDTHDPLPIMLQVIREFHLGS